MIDAVYAPEDIRILVNASPEAAARHDKEIWLSLFARQAVIEDPVGTAPHWRGNGEGIGALERFYETFIAPNDITFHVHRDIIAGKTMIRDVTIEIVSHVGLTSRVHTYILYELTQEDGRLKIARLAAYWELFPMIKHVVGGGLPGIKMMINLSWRMLRIEGIVGVLGYMSGYKGIGHRGKDTVDHFVAAVNACAFESLEDLFDPGTTIDFPVNGLTYSPSSLSPVFDGSLNVTDLISAGMATAFRFETESKNPPQNGIGLFEFHVKSKRIKRARIFMNEVKGEQTI